MEQYINAVEAAEKVAVATGINIADLMDIFAEIPAADVAQVVHGRWIEDHDYLKCPKCGAMVKRDFTFFDIGDWHYCPNCGAKMDGGTENATD